MSWVLVAMRVLLPTALVDIVLVIWLLTVQTPAETVGLSEGWVRLLTDLSPLSHDQSFWVVRKVVHAVEFFPVGLFVALSLAAWSGGPKLLGRHIATSPRLPLHAAAICLALSLGDQLHKTFVPGREFDALDLCFDAAGYLLAIWVARKVWDRLRKRI